MPRQARDQEKTRAKILAAATTLFIDKGCDGITMDNVARSIHISKRTLYETYADKEALLEDCCRELQYHITDKIRKISAQEDDKLFLFLFFVRVASLMEVRYHKFLQDLQERYPRIFALYFHPKRFEDQAKLTDMIRQGIESGDIVPHINVKEFARFLSLLGKMATLAYPDNIKLQQLFVNIFGFTLIRGILTPQAILRYDQPERDVNNVMLKQDLIKIFVPNGKEGKEYINSIITDINNEMMQAGEKATRPKAKPKAAPKAKAKPAPATAPSAPTAPRAKAKPRPKAKAQPSAPTETRAKAKPRPKTKTKTQ